MVQLGDQFTAFRPDGSPRAVLTVEHVEGEGAPVNLVRLLNPASGGVAQVTVKWLTEGKLDGRAHWLPGDHMAASTGASSASE